MPAAVNLRLPRLLPLIAMCSFFAACGGGGDESAMLEPADPAEKSMAPHVGTSAFDAVRPDAAQKTPPAPPGPRVKAFYASAPIVAVAGQVIAYVRIENPAGPCIVVPTEAAGVVIRDSDIGPCGGEANIVIQGPDTTVEHVRVHRGNRGVLAQYTTGTTTRLSVFDTFYGPAYYGTAIEYDYLNVGVIDRNVVRGRDYASDAVSIFESSNIRLTGNDIDIHVAEPSSAAFTVGDSTRRRPGANNYAAYNIVRQTGGVPAGVFGSNGDTVLERNCLTGGIQAYDYSGVFLDVTVRHNVIHMGASFVPRPLWIKEWSTNIDSTDCSLVPR